ncbi:DNA mismatch repair protein MutL, partial [Bacillus sp. JJ1764]
TTIKDTFKSKVLIPTAYTHVKKETPKTEQTTLVLDEGTSTSQKFEEEETIKPVEVERPWTAPITIRENFPEKVEAEDTWTSVDPFAGFSKRVGPVVEEEVKPVEEPKTESRVPRMYPIGQMHGTYIFAQNENGLYIIDQHAAQERLKYEYFREKVGRVEPELQEILMPLTFEYSTDDYLKIMEYKDELEKVGVFLEEFGLNSFVVRSHPQWLPKGEEKEIIEEMIEQLLSMKKVDIKKLREEAAIMMSCKASIKANRHLRNDEIQTLLDDLRKASDPFTCPHGRPIIVHYSVYEMEKMFKRVM